MSKSMRKRAGARTRTASALVSVSVVLWASALSAAPKNYSLPGVNLRERVIWGATCDEPDGAGLAFGGQDQQAEDGRPHTRIKVGGEWRSIHGELRSRNRLQSLHNELRALRDRLKGALASTRRVFFSGLGPEEERERLETSVVPELRALIEELKASPKEAGAIEGLDDYGAGQARAALAYLEKGQKLVEPLAKALAKGVSAQELATMLSAQVLLEKAAEALDAEPPPRALTGVVYDAKTKLYVMFGGDHLDYVTNDTWVFDPAKRQWRQRHPGTAPPPRAQYPPKPHPDAKVAWMRRQWPERPMLIANGDGTVTLEGGYRYSSNTDYLGGQYRDAEQGEWTYDIVADKWTGGEGVPADSREYRTGPFHPSFFIRGEKPNAEETEARLQNLPANTWVSLKPPYRPRQNRDWGKCIIDPDRDLILYWSGGHSAHGGSDVLHYHLSTNRWELPFPVEFPLGQTYSNTSYPGGYNLNRRPWVTGHTYNSYAYDVPSRKMVFVGQQSRYFVYDPDVADWVGFGKKPESMVYGGCFFTLTACSTPGGVMVWTAHGAICGYDGVNDTWTELKLSGEKLPGATVDSSTIAYDSKRQRLLCVRKPYGRARFNGQVHAVSVESGAVQALEPVNKAAGVLISGLDRCSYDPENDLMLLATTLPSKDTINRLMPAYDCANNRWVSLTVTGPITKRGGKETATIPGGHSMGLVYDTKRSLYWAATTQCNVYAMKLDLPNANVTELKPPPPPPPPEQPKMDVPDVADDPNAELEVE